MSQIRLADPPPVRCSACFGQYPARRHVDFGAVWDGPTFPAEGVAGGGIVAIDDLVICEECLTTAAALIGLAESPVQRLAEAEAARVELGEQLVGAQDYIDKLERAIAVRPVRSKPKIRAVA